MYALCFGLMARELFIGSVTISVILEWTKQFRRIAGRKIAGDLCLEEIDKRIRVGFGRVILNDSMTRHATHAVTRQSSIDILVVRWWIRIVSSVDEITFKITFIRTTMIVVEPSFTHHAVTLEARIVDGLDLLRDLCRIVFKETLHETQFRFRVVRRRPDRDRPVPSATSATRRMVKRSLPELSHLFASCRCRSSRFHTCRHCDNPCIDRT